MPAKSKAQARFMYAVQAGTVKKTGLSPAKAKEFTSGVSLKGLPDRAKRGKRISLRGKRGR